MTTESMHAFIEEANQLYLTDPAGAVALLYEGAKELKRKPSSKGVTESKTEKSRDARILEAGFQLMEWLKEDALEGILPDSLEWELDIGVAQHIVRITREYGC